MAAGMGKIFVPMAFLKKGRTHHIWLVVEHDWTVWALHIMWLSHWDGNTQMIQTSNNRHKIRTLKMWCTTLKFHHMLPGTTFGSIKFCKAYHARSLSVKPQFVFAKLQFVWLRASIFVVSSSFAWYRHSKFCWQKMKLYPTIETTQFYIIKNSTKRPGPSKSRRPKTFDKGAAAAAGRSGRVASQRRSPSLRKFHGILIKSDPEWDMLCVCVFFRTIALSLVFVFTLHLSTSFFSLSYLVLSSFVHLLFPSLPFSSLFFSFLLFSFLLFSSFIYLWKWCSRNKWILETVWSGNCFYYVTESCCLSLS